jgi:uncharacterized membrane protein
MEKKMALAGAAIAAISMAAGCAHTHQQMAGDGSKCFGVNACKGQGACSGPGHSCNGKNACKGQGWLSLAQADCESKGGTFKAL